MRTIDEQLAVFRRGTAAILPDEQALRRKLAQGRPLRVKLGVDPTIGDLHLGHSIPLRKLRQLQDLGHQVDFIIGNFTALVGDPSGASVTRPTRTPDEVAQFARTYEEQAFRILDRERTRVLYNADWLAPLNMTDILALTSRFTVARMLERDDFAERFAGGAPIHLHELLYPLLQAFDSVKLASDVEIGGTDQTFNLLTGRTIMERFDLEPQVVLTLPLLRGTDGSRKMSKSYGNFVGITEAPLAIYSKVLSIPDELMREWFELVSDLSLADIDRSFAELDAGTRHPKELKKLLARRVVAVYQGELAVAVAESEWERIHEQSAFHAPEDAEELYVPASETMWIVELVERAAFRTPRGEALSRSEIRRLVAQGGIKIDGEAVTDFAHQVPLRDGLVIAKGNKDFRRLRVTDGG